jgi:hypothetical protein
MGRPRRTWTDDQLRAILAILPALERDFPHDNGAFLDALIAEVRVLTGRVFGAAAYDGLLKNVGPQAGVVRRPSSATVQQAVARAQALAAPAVDAAEAAPETLPVPFRNELHNLLAPVMRDALAPLHALLQPPVTASARPDERAAMVELQLTRAALEDAHARIRHLEVDQAQLRRALGAAEAARDLAGAHVQTMLAGLLDAIRDAGSGASELAATAQRLAGTEQFLKIQQDAVRQQATAEADALRRQVEQLQIEIDQYRRAMSAQRGSAGAAG